jgi:hypothetical protein
MKRPPLEQSGRNRRHTGALMASPALGRLSAHLRPPTALQTGRPWQHASRWRVRIACFGTAAQISKLTPSSSRTYLLSWAQMS